MINLEVWLARLGSGCQSRTGVSYKARLTSVLGHHQLWHFSCLDSEYTSTYELKIVEVLKCRFATRGRRHVLDIPVAQQAEIETFATLCTKAFGGVASHGRHNASCEAQLSPVWKLLDRSWWYSRTYVVRDCDVFIVLHSSAQFCNSALGLPLRSWPSQLFSSIRDYLRLAMLAFWEVLMQLSTWNLSWCPAF